MELIGVEISYAVFGIAILVSSLLVLLCSERGFTGIKRTCRRQTRHLFPLVWVIEKELL
jgi:hypothetical protein